MSGNLQSGCPLKADSAKALGGLGAMALRATSALQRHGVQRVAHAQYFSEPSFSCLSVQGSPKGRFHLLARVSTFNFTLCALFRQSRSTFCAVGAVWDPSFPGFLRRAMCLRGGPVPPAPQTWLTVQETWLTPRGFGESRIRARRLQRVFWVLGVQKRVEIDLLGSGICWIPEKAFLSWRWADR